MTKSDLIEHLSEKLKLPKGKAEQLVNIVFDSMEQALRRGERIEIRGFGSFEIRYYKAYEGRNPRTGDPVGVQPKRLPFFKVGKELKERVNTAFAEVMEACGDPRRPHGWIDASFVDAYCGLHHLGWAHSVEVWQGDALVGGLYGVRIGRFFAGESMFHRATNASKVAVWATVELLRLDGAVLFDVQWTTPHLLSLGAVDVERDEYLRLLASAVMEPVQIFHNPSCSKSRGALQILEERGVDANVVKYLDTPPDRATLERILDAIDTDPMSLVRTGDATFKGAGLTKADVQSRAQVIDVLLAHPEVMERPVVFVGEKALIARPSERVLELLD